MASKRFQSNIEPAISVVEPELDDANGTRRYLLHDSLFSENNASGFRDTTWVEEEKKLTLILPIADAGKDLIVNEDWPIDMNAFGSIDPDSIILSLVVGNKILFLW